MQPRRTTRTIHGRPALGLLLAAVLIVVTGSPVAAQAAPGRVRPPENVACPRDHLTVYGGQVLGYQRKSGRT